ncbi:MAG: UvrD-helicase domain-containing protein [Spirochaetaceae bacterium]|nr:UvrD-helicase domain-containing protein [Spirochaetaceae bacterium]
MEEFEISSANLDKNMVIKASAGTGKTYSLEHLVIRYIVDKGCDISEILVVTFTNKAAFELENRIRTLLKKKALEVNSVSNKVYAKRIKEAFSRFSESQIYTIHGFCKNCLHNFPFESGVPFRTSVMTSEDIYTEAIHDFLRTAENSELSDFYLSFRKKYKNISEIVKLFISIINDRYILEKNEIIPDQSFIDKTEKYCYDFLSGKGKLYTAIKKLSDCDPSPHAMKDISKKMKLGLRDNTFEVLSKLLKLILKAKTVGEVFSDDFLVDADRLRKYSFDYISENKDTPILNPNELSLTKIISDIFNELEIFKDNSSDEDSNNYIYHNIASYIFIKKASLRIIEFAQQKKKKAAIYDFDDLVELTRNAVTANNGNSPLANELRRKYKIVLIDEFQDTDISQWEIFSTIFRGEQHKIVLIGDPKQSIYRFRGGDLEIYLKAVNNLANASTYELATCYRSTSNIVKGINDIFSKVFLNSSSGGGEIKYLNVRSYEDNPGIKTDQGDVSKNSSIEGNKSIVEFIAIENESDEKSKKEVEPLIENIYGNEIRKLLEQGMSPSSIAILMETNSSCIRMLNHLKRLGIPAIYEGKLNIFDSHEAYQFIDLLYALSSPNNMAIVRKSLFSEFFAISAEDIIRIENSFNMDNIAEKFAIWSEKTANGKFYEVMDEIFYKNNPILVVASLSNEDIKKPYIARTLEKLGGRGKVANVMHIFEMLIKKNMKEKQDAASLLRYMISAMKGYENIEEKIVRLENEPDCVKIITIHVSKGREFPVVFFSGGLGKSEPKPSRDNYYEFVEKGKRYIDFSKSSFARKKEIYELWEEKKRLYYVAMTRASKKLYIPIIKNPPGTDLVSFYASLVFDKLSKEMEKTGVDLSIPVNTQKKDLPKDMKVTEYKEILHNKIFELIKDFCNGKQYFKFNNIKSSDILYNSEMCEGQSDSEALMDSVLTSALVMTGSGNIKQSDQATLGNSVLQQNDTLSLLSCPEPSYKKDDAQKGFWLYSYTTFVKNKTHIALHSAGIRNLENPEKENEEADDTISSEDNIGIKGVDFGNIMHKLLETASYPKVMQHKDIDSAVKDEELLNFAENCARGFTNSYLAYKSREYVIKLLYKTLTTPINVGGSLIRIGDIPESDRKHEIDFIFKIKHGKIDIGKELSGFDLKDGFIKGFIDMIFRFNGSYYIVDWKTNYLGSSLNDYDQINLEKAMISNNYKIQIYLYSIALDMMITSENNNGFTTSSDNAEVPCVNKPAIGGYFYLFLRGLSGKGVKVKDADEKNNILYPGIYFSSPDYDAINNFKKTFLE